MIRGLFCGISEYRANQKLPYCVNDAKKMKETFESVFLCSKDSINILAMNGEIENSKYTRELQKFSKSCTEEDIAIVYYSGHGGVDEAGANYLYATNTYEGNSTTYIYFDIIIERLKESKAKSKLIIIDACHADSNYGTEQQKFDIDQALEIVYKSGITAIFSCRNDQESYPYNSGEISAFTQFLCDAINYKKSYQPEGLYLNDLKITIDAYARAWNLKNESKQQQPVLRSNMIGTIVLPLKNPPVVSERKTMTARFETFDALDIKCQVKKPSSLKDYQKVYRANIVAKVDISDENIVAFAKDVIKELKSMNLQPKSKEAWLIKNKTVDVIQLWIAKDYMDVGSENNNFAYQVYWEVADDLYWCKKLGDKRIQLGNIAYRKNKNYEKERENREKYILPDNMIIDFWTKNLKKLIVETENVIYMYSNFYVNKEMSYKDLRKKANMTYCKLNDTYKDIRDAWWPLPNSDLKVYASYSNDLAVDIQELLFLFNSSKGEEWVINNFSLRLEKYYRSVEKWKNMTKTL